MIVAIVPAVSSLQTFDIVPIPIVGKLGFHFSQFSGTGPECCVFPRYAHSDILFNSVSEFRLPCTTILPHQSRNVKRFPQNCPLKTILISWPTQYPATRAMTSIICNSPLGWVTRFLYLYYTLSAFDCQLIYYIYLKNELTMPDVRESYYIACSKTSWLWLNFANQIIQSDTIHPNHPDHPDHPIVSNLSNLSS